MAWFRTLARAIRVRVSARSPDGAPRWRSPLRLLIAFATILAVVAPMAWVLLGATSRLSSGEQTALEIVVLVVMAALTLTSSWQLNLCVLQMVQLRASILYGRVVPDLQWVVAYYELEAAVYRAIGKLALVLAMGLLVLARNADVRRWLIDRPLAFPALLLDAMVIFTAVDVLTALYRHATRQARMPHTVEEQVELIDRRIVVVEHRAAALENRLASVEFTIRSTLLPAQIEDEDESPAADPA